MTGQYPSEGYVWLLRIVALAALVGLGATIAQNRDLEAEKAKQPPTCMVNSPNGIDMCSDAPKVMPLFEPESHDYIPPPP